MASGAIFSSLRRRRFPSLEAFLAPVDLTDVALVQTLVSVASELVSCFSGRSFFFQRKNSRALMREVEVFQLLLEYLRDSETKIPMAGLFCLKELYLLLYRSKRLLDYCAQSSKLCLLLHNHSVSGHFHDLNKEISTLLDVFPIKDVELSEEIREQIELLLKQSRRAKLFIDKKDDELRTEFLSYLDEFENGRVPDSAGLRSFFFYEEIAYTGC